MILAVLQNQWFKDPEHWRRVFAQIDLDKRARLVSRLLFAGCSSGTRLRQVLGEDLCNRVVWENASTYIGGRSSASEPADPEHLFRVVSHHRPDVVWAFGKIAEIGVRNVHARCSVAGCAFRIVASPHPAARARNTADRIREDMAAVVAVETAPRCDPGLWPSQR